MSKIAAELSEVKTLIRTLLISSPREATVDSLCKDFKDSEGRDLPYRKLGYSSPTEFLKSIPDVVRVQECHGRYSRVYPVASQKSRHIQDLVSRQKPSRSMGSFAPPPPRRAYALGCSSHRGGGGGRERSMGPVPPRPRRSEEQQLFIPVTIKSCLHNLLKEHPEGVPIKKAEQAICNYPLENLRIRGVEDVVKSFPQLFRMSDGYVYGADQMQPAAPIKPLLEPAILVKCLEKKPSFKKPTTTMPPSGFKGGSDFVESENIACKTNTFNTNKNWRSESNSTNDFPDANWKLDESWPRNSGWQNNPTVNRRPETCANRNVTYNRWSQGVNGPPSTTSFKPVESKVVMKSSARLSNEGQQDHNRSTITNGFVTPVNSDPAIIQAFPAVPSAQVDKEDLAACSPYYRVPEPVVSWNDIKRPPPKKVIENYAKNNEKEDDSRSGDSGGSSDERRKNNPCINDRIVANLRKLLDKHPEGIWCSEISGFYQKEFGSRLVSRDLGYMSAVQLVSDLPEVFYIVRLDDEDFKLLDTRKPLPKCYEKYELSNPLYGKEATDESPTVTEPVSRNIEWLLQAHPEGIMIEKLLAYYEDSFLTTFDYIRMGFESMESFVLALKEKGTIRLRYEGTSITVLSANHVPDPILHPPPPIEDFQAFEEEELLDIVYPPDIIGPGCNVEQVAIPDSIGQWNSLLEVIVAEVTTPSSFWVMMRGRDYSTALDHLMDELQGFYVLNERDYRMPEVMACIGQECCCKWGDEWHRARITSVTNLTEVEIFYYDYGSKRKVKKKDVRFLHDSFFSLPAQAIQAQLANVVPPGGSKSWPRASGSRLLELVSERSLVGVVGAVDPQRRLLSLSLVDTAGRDDICINDVLVKEGHASYLSDLQPASQQPQPQPRVKRPRTSLQHTENASVPVSSRPPPGFKAPVPATPKITPIVENAKTTDTDMIYSAMVSGTLATASHPLPTTAQQSSPYLQNPSASPAIKIPPPISSPSSVNQPGIPDNSQLYAGNPLMCLGSLSGMQYAPSTAMSYYALLQIEQQKVMQQKAVLDLLLLNSFNHVNPSAPDVAATYRQLSPLVSDFLSQTLQVPVAPSITQTQPPTPQVTLTDVRSSPPTPQVPLTDVINSPPNLSQHKTVNSMSSNTNSTFHSLSDVNSQTFPSPASSDASLCTSSEPETTNRLCTSVEQPVLVAEPSFFSEFPDSRDSCEKTEKPADYYSRLPCFRVQSRTNNSAVKTVPTILPVSPSSQQTVEIKMPTREWEEVTDENHPQNMSSNLQAFKLTPEAIERFEKSLRLQTYDEVSQNEYNEVCPWTPMQRTSSRLSLQSVEDDEVIFRSDDESEEEEHEVEEEEEPVEEEEDEEVIEEEEEEVLPMLPRIVNPHWVKRIEIAGRPLHLVNVHDRAYLCTDEFVRMFTAFSGRHVVLKILEASNLNIHFMEIGRHEFNMIFTVLDMSNSESLVRANSGYLKNPLHLTPLASTPQVLAMLKIYDQPILQALQEEINSFNPQDIYWVGGIIKSNKSRTS